MREELELICYGMVITTISYYAIKRIYETLKYRKSRKIENIITTYMEHELRYETHFIDAVSEIVEERYELKKKEEALL